MTPAELIERLAMERWRAREMIFPGRVRRMNPDALDRITGAWRLCFEEAREDLRALSQSLPKETG